MVTVTSNALRRLVCNRELVWLDGRVTVCVVDCLGKVVGNECSNAMMLVSAQRDTRWKGMDLFDKLVPRFLPFLLSWLQHPALLRASQLIAQ